ncbi:AsmA family protein [Undibacterium sp. TJN25]|uniref:AsmA family protein n=1 Tax=Undibacterium sp. TJN25 TaxID=3413056 RepID=UPI003BF3AC19
MNKLVKIIGLSLLLLALLFGALLGYLAFGFDANQFKTRIVQLVKDKKQRTLSIDGDIKLSVFPSLGVDLGKTSLSARDSEAGFAMLKSAHISLALLPLLRKEIVLDSIAIDGLELTLERHAEDDAASGNADDLLHKDEAAGDAMKFDIKGIALTGATIHIEDTVNHVSGSLNKLDFSSGRLTDKVATELKFSTELDFRQPALQGKITAQTGLLFDLETGMAELSNLDLFAKGSMDNDAGKAFDIVAKADDLKYNGKTPALTVVGLALTAKAPLGQDKAELNLEAPRLAIDQNSAGGDTVKGNFTLSGTRSLELGYQLSGISGTSRELTIKNLALNLSQKQGARTISGKIESTVRAQPGLRYASLPDINASLKVEDPGMPQKTLALPVTGKLDIDLKKQTLAGSLHSRFDDSTINGSFAAAQFGRAGTQFELAIDRLNLDRYMAPAAAEKIPASAPPAIAQPEKPLDLSALKTLQLNGNVQIGQLQLKKIRFSDVSLPLKASQGKLEMAPLSARLYQGALSGSAVVDANTNHFALRTTLTDVSVNPLLKDALGHDILEGRGKLVLNLNTAGTTASAMKRALEGDISAELHDGAVKGINLAKSLRDFKNRILAKSDQHQAASTAEKTDFSSLSASMHLQDGIGKSDDLSLKSPFLRAGGNGTLNVVNGSLDYTANVIAVNTAAGQGGAELAQLKNITVPVHISGPLTALGYNIQWSAIAGDALKSAIAEKAKPVLDEKKQELKSKLQDKLKGLLGR